MNKRSIVYDSNVIIDFKAGKIRDSIFRIVETVTVSRTVYNKELKKERKYLAPHLLDGKLKILERTQEIEQITSGLQKYRTARTDIYDLFCLASAIYLSAPLATGDAELRAAATKEKCQLTGTIGIAKKIVEAGFDAEKMLTAFELMKQRRRRLPWALALKEIGELRKGKDD